MKKYPCIYRYECSRCGVTVRQYGFTQQKIQGSAVITLHMLCLICSGKQSGKDVNRGRK
jgi:hypothetical protein